MTKDLFRHGPEQQLPQTSSTMSTYDHHVHLLLPYDKFQLFPDIALADDEVMVQTRQRPTFDQLLLQLSCLSLGFFCC